ncbi:hypothetical protein [Vibrio sp. 99-8-1]|uniref:hypothetical protein n=1 Tax=Vibrio sp. 99-8-1 TaxID=2607602 RepID=UPI0014937952|nr:hypothetical protein [Vibrio sp. 99-8-1]
MSILLLSLSDQIISQLDEFLFGSTDPSLNIEENKKGLAIVANPSWIRFKD